MKKVTIDKNRVRKIMKEKNIRSQNQLALNMGITKNQLSAILSEKFTPIKSNVEKLCEVLDIGFDEIMCVEDVNEKQIKFINICSSNEDYVEYRDCTYKEASESELNSEEENKSNEQVDISNVLAKRPYTCVELFAGAGGLALGLEKAGFKEVGLVELDKYACDTLKLNRPGWNVIQGDVVKIAENGIKNYIDNNIEIDLLSGGYPCQAFSYAGKKLGLEDVRGTLFYSYAKILEELKPKVFLAENVRGLVSHDDGKTLKTMVDVFSEIGYNVKYEILKAVNYGVAQKRERVIIIGTRKDLSHVDFKFPKPFEYVATLRDALKNVPKSEGARYPERKKKVLDMVPPGGCWIDLPDEVARDYMGKSYYSGGGKRGMARRISWDEPCLTLTCSPAQKQTERCHPDETRPFTTREYARIQSFPDEWEFTGSVSQVYKQIGNAVPVKLGKAIGLSIVDYLNKIEKIYVIEEVAITEEEYII
ncbi:TPA: DNA (cytosine-5-)-methyltransferase [Clostridioides difficile]|uniref:DNA (cytosine-5-)-methyltransferase n=1 Tax=Clostridioides difficile TaxID=1496 RepID=UPI00093EA0C7|nr:DNA (cytosine-5-)-methyltransferase [Clostridioides difficile]MBH7065096.1 DNA (cytosine-5-)-methyltransferase [Clostridioides difficile]MBH7077433.1 DNA (cytosine-5-)-methyltransferase [Clostridioides difficile]MBH7103271.1 DNA (cytosine-5-)-methyltransferase [Clostridioides difficile]MBH8063920.1 DNA (cytosine-5-)-methyltransferase [Clostridioides difficile]MBJ8638076.1 DNA (cytosine-5-)-methyltransferase [Clostridioides difficile]